MVVLVPLGASPRPLRFRSRSANRRWASTIDPSWALPPRLRLRSPWPPVLNAWKVIAPAPAAVAVMFWLVVAVVVSVANVKASPARWPRSSPVALAIAESEVLPVVNGGDGQVAAD